MAKKGGKKGKGMVVSKTKRANHLKHKKSYRNGVAKAGTNKEVYQHSDKTKNERTPRSKLKNEGDSRSKSRNEGNSRSKSKNEGNTRSKSKNEGIPRLKIKGRPVKKGRKPQTHDDNGLDFDADELMDMMDPEDLALLAGNGNGDLSTKQKKRKRDEDDNIEEEYEGELAEKEKGSKKTRPLLPIKTSQGLVERSVELDEPEEPASDQEDEEEEEEKEPWKPLGAAEAYAQRLKKIEDLKTALGNTSSNLIENPDENLDSLSTLLKMYEQLGPDILITGTKLISASLVEIFKDLAPGFEIKQTSKPGEKLKKATRVVYGNEGRLLKYYQIFLKKLENMFNPLKEGRKGKTVPESKQRIGVFALKCMADLLVSMPHFNFAKNIVHALIPFTAHKNDEMRQMICETFKKLFKEDKRGEISLHAVRQVNHLIKNKRNYQIPPESLDILLALRIKDVNLDKEREEEINRYKTLTRKEKLLIMSKNERRRRKKIERLEKEIVAARAEDNKETKAKFQTETVKVVFTIYFRILKIAPKSGLLGTVLQGLAKFAHTINVEFFTDLVEVLNGLITSDYLDHRQCLHAIQVVLIMLSGQGEALNIDPLYFYSHLYRMLFQLTAGPSNEDMPIALDCLDNMLIKRRKKVSMHRVLAFTKRIATLCLQVQHNSGVALLSFLRSLMMTHKQTDMLLDMEASSGAGSFLPELEEPEHCNAGSTVLWELHALTRHYHPVVAKFARHLLHKNPTTGPGQLALEMTRKTPLDLHTEFSASSLAFNPPVQSPSNAPISWKKMAPEEFHSEELQEQISRVMAMEPVTVWDDEAVDRLLAASR